MPGSELYEKFMALFEDGYGDTPEDVTVTVEAAVEFGLAGIGVEDTSGNPDQPIRDFDDAVDRVRSAVDAAKGRIVVTGRTDNFIQGRPDLDDTIRRLTAFAEVGADVLLAVAELRKAGVKRISLGPFLYIHAMGALEQATEALVAGDLATASTGISFERIDELLARVKN